MSLAPIMCRERIGVVLVGRCELVFAIYIRVISRVLYRAWRVRS